MDTDTPKLQSLQSKVGEWLGGCEEWETLKRNGRNNRVFALVSGGSKYVCKQYYRGETERFSGRQDAEWRFAQLANRRAPGKSPRALFRDEGLAISLFEYIEGSSLSLPIKDAEVRDAFQFLKQVNEDRELASSFPLASDSCFSLEHHVSHVERRLRAFEALEDEGLKLFLSDGLRPVFDAGRKSLSSLPGAGGEGLRQEERLLSPSDFGFHNALSDAVGDIVYLDFEYAGWDDPVKCLCDFFAQPDFPAPLSSLDSASELLPNKQGRPVEELAMMLLPLYVVKWSCIMLNPYLREVRERRQFASGAGEEKVEVLLAAKRYFEQHAARRLKTWPT